MLEGTIPAILDTFHAWLTPTILFLLINIVIGTIAVTSKTSRRDDDPIPVAAGAAVENDGIGAKLSRTSSAIFYRLGSFNLHLHRPADTPLDPTPPLPPTPAINPDPVAEKSDPESKDLASGEVGEIDLHLSQSQTAARLAAQRGRETKLAALMKKSDSKKYHFGHLENPQILQRADGVGGEEGGEVDARADDFINRFRQQLKLQRLDSIIRYKGMLNRGH